MTASVSSQDMLQVSLRAAKVGLREFLEDGTDAAEIIIPATVQKMNVYDLNMFTFIPNKPYME